MSDLVEGELAADRSCTLCNLSLVASLKWVGTFVIWLILFAFPLGFVLACLALLGRKAFETRLALIHFG